MHFALAFQGSASDLRAPELRVLLALAKAEQNPGAKWVLPMPGESRVTTHGIVQVRCSEAEEFENMLAVLFWRGVFDRRSALSSRRLGTPPYVVGLHAKLSKTACLSLTLAKLCWPFDCYIIGKSACLGLHCFRVTLLRSSYSASFSKKKHMSCFQQVQNVQLQLQCSSSAAFLVVQVW